MNTKNENVSPAQLSSVNENESVPSGGADTSKKSFVEPEVSFPIDVLESTTFFQFTESGATN